MPELRPFRGLRYDPRVIPDAAAVLCPPYDIISPDRRAALVARHSRNAVHLELPVAHGAAAAAGAYREAGRIFAGWRRDGTLVRDDKPLIYVYEQRYRDADDGERTVRGFFCRLRLEPLGRDTGVRPHERTMTGPKEDRYRLLEAVAANLSPVLLLYESNENSRASGDLLDELTSAPPELAAVDDEGVTHLLWTADPQASDTARELLSVASERPLTIADGHHRYETALRYQSDRRGDAPAGSAAADYVLALLYDASTSGLDVLPTHRLVHDGPAGTELIDALRPFFEVSPVASVEDVLAGLRRPGRIGLWSAAGGAVLEANRQSVQNVLPGPSSEALRWLDVTVLSSLLPRIYGSEPHEMVDSGRLTYVKDAREATAVIDRGDAVACFLLPPTPTSAVLEIAATGEQMPHKSTYFYPKAATGLVFNTLDE